MGRSLDVTLDADPVQAICDYLGEGRTTSAKCLAQKAVVLLAPAHLLGSLIWLAKPVRST
jgi:hypothetical protein